MTLTFDSADFDVATPEARADPQRGLPSPLPPGERIVWVGGPDRREFARQVFHVRAVAAYFAVIALWQAGTAFADGGNWADASGRVAVLALACAATLGILHGLAWLAARTTVYTITTARIVMRIGSALPKTIDVPFGIIENADLDLGRNGTGNIALDVGRESKVAYALLWPHARPWHVRDPKPMLRAIPDAERVAGLLAQHVGRSTASRDETTPPPEADYVLRDEHQNPAPRRFVVAMAALAGFALLVAFVGSRTGAGTTGAEFGTPVRATALSFEDRGPDSFALVQENGEDIALIEPGREGLLRNTRRAHEHKRRLQGIALDRPYKLTVWDSGRLTLLDPETGQNVRLDFFGRPPEGPLSALHELAGLRDADGSAIPVTPAPASAPAPAPVAATPATAATN